MTTPSNLYAEKVFSEQPTGLWALDDQADYISLITEVEREVETQWTVSNGSANTLTSLSTQPFPNSFLSEILGTNPTTPTQTIGCVSPDLVNFEDLNPILGTVSVGAYFYSNSPYLDSVSIGYEYTDTSTSLIVQDLKTYNITTLQKWVFISYTLPIVNEFTNLRAVINFNVNDGGSSSSDYQFYINGVTVGQWAEEFQATSLGANPIAFPANIALAASYAIEADQYGLGGDVGYYIVEDNSLLARNTSIPLVYGASGVTKLSPSSSGLPSLIIPGKGFLNKAGQNKQYTAEFWMRINSGTNTPKRIFGPIGSTDGLYVESGFITFVVGNRFGSHFVGEWYRPMLINIIMIRDSVSVLLNGEQVINFAINTDTLSLPNLLDQNGDSLDWLGFYAYDDVSPIEVDCVAIYPYSVPVNVAKRRWVYGQAVVSPEGINSAYGGTSAFIDYPFADYTSDYKYPDFAKWQQGSFDNLNTTGTSLQTPNYSLPEISIPTKTLENLYTDNQDIQVTGDKFITFRPNASWNNVKSYFNFPRFNILNNQTAAIYGVFESSDLATEEILFKIYNPLTGNYFVIEKDLDEIHYYLMYNGVQEEIYTTDVILEDEMFSAGIIINDLVDTFGGNVAAFFGNQNGLSMYVAGDETGTSPFTGKIYCVSLCSQYNVSQISDHFENGIAILDSHLATGSAISENAKALLAHTASYTLLPLEAYGSYFLDIGVSGYWEDYLPLSYFGQYVKNDVGNLYYDLDFLQFNIGYPRPLKLSEYETTSSWTYEELVEEFTHPLQTTYAQLDNYLYTGWNDYQDMSEKAVKFYEYDTQDASIRSYITFQYVSEGANAPQDAFTVTEPAPEDLILDMDSYPNWPVTKFEVLNDTIIYPTKSIDFNDLAIVYRLDFNIRGIISKPIALRRLEFASQAFNDNSFNPVGTAFGVDLFPYKQSGIYFDYKAKNPFSIYKGSTPYLYLTRDSGIEIRGEYDPFSSRGLALPINQTLASNYRISAVQLWMKYDKDKFPLNPIELFEVDYKADTIKFYVVADSETGLRGKIFAKSATTGLDFNGLSYYWNGNLVKEPVMTIKEWGSLGIGFAQSLNLDAYLGSINLTGQVVFNNIAYYQANNLQQVQSTITRSWLGVKTDGALNFDWDYWFNSFNWQGVLIIGQSDIYGVNPSDVYKTYIGTNKIIIDDGDGMSLNSDAIGIYSATQWTVSVGTPV